jgi:hypothetical protein
MSAYTVSYSIRYQIPSLQQQIEVAVITAANDIQHEDPASPDHAKRLAWSTWAIANSSVAYQSFAWPVAVNPSIVGSIQTDPTGASVPDSDVQFVVNSVLPQVIAAFVPPPTV